MNPSLLQLLLGLYNTDPHSQVKSNRNFHLEEQLRNRPLLNDLGQRYLPGFNEALGIPDLGDWVNNTGQSLFNDYLNYRSLVPPLMVTPQLNPQFKGTKNYIFDPYGETLNSLLGGRIS